jgi:hypothetical protein
MRGIVQQRTCGASGDQARDGEKRDLTAAVAGMEGILTGLDRGPALRFNGLNGKERPSGKPSRSRV